MPVDFIVGAAVGVAVVSKRVRQVLRKGLIYGVGGVVVAYDKVAAMAHGVRQTVHQATSSSATASTTPPPGPAPAPQPSPQNVSANTSSPAGTPS